MMATSFMDLHGRYANGTSDLTGSIQPLSANVGSARHYTANLLLHNWVIHCIIVNFIGIGCPYLKAPSYGKIRIDGHGYSSVAYYSCDYGYELYGPSSRKCLHGGSWYGKEPICRPKRSKSCMIQITCMFQNKITINAENCPKLYAPQYGKIRVTGYGPDSVAYYSCDYGYDLHGLDSRKCLHDGSWYGKIPICRPKRSKLSLLSFSLSELLPMWILSAGDCPKLYAPKYGKVRVTGYGPDSLAYYSCDYGYDLHGPASRKCQYDGSWYGKIPICRPKRSKLSPLSFPLSELLAMWILSAGDCPKLYAPKYGKVRVTGYGPDSLAYYSCDYGYDLHGPASRKCQYDGSWYGKIPICRPKRSKLSPLSFPLSELLAMWILSAGDCPKLYAPKYGKVRVTGYGPDSLAYYSCDYGYDLHGPASRKCQYDGSWYGKIPICRPKRSKLSPLSFPLSELLAMWILSAGDCPKLYAPKYGKVRVTGYGPDSLAYYSCDYGYDLHGPASRKCQYDGSWYGKIPICRPKRSKLSPLSFPLSELLAMWKLSAGDCPKLYAPKYGKVRVTGYGPDSLAYYSCDYGYELYGPASRKCQYDGSWYGKIPVCRPKRKSKLLYSFPNKLIHNGLSL